MMGSAHMDMMKLKARKDVSGGSHYENTPIQVLKFKMKISSRFFFFHIFLIFAQNINCGYSVELPQEGGSNVYPQSMF